MAHRAARVSAELGIPVVPIVAIRKGGIAELLEAIDRMSALEAADPRPHGWREPVAEEIRATHATATRDPQGLPSIPVTRS